MNRWRNEGCGLRPTSLSGSSHHFLKFLRSSNALLGALPPSVVHFSLSASILPLDWIPIQVSPISRKTFATALLPSLVPSLSFQI